MSTCKQRTRCPIEKYSSLPSYLEDDGNFMAVRSGHSVFFYTRDLSAVKVKSTLGDWQHLLSGMHPNGVEFPMRIQYYKPLKGDGQGLKFILRKPLRSSCYFLRQLSTTFDNLVFLVLLLFFDNSISLMFIPSAVEPWLNQGIVINYPPSWPLS